MEQRNKIEYVREDGEDIQIGEHKITNLGNGHTIFQWVGA